MGLPIGRTLNHVLIFSFCSSSCSFPFLLTHQPVCPLYPSFNIYSRSPLYDSSGTSSRRLFPTSRDIFLRLKIHTSTIYASKKPRSDHLCPCTSLFHRRVELENSKGCH